MTTYNRVVPSNEFDTAPGNTHAGLGPSDASHGDVVGSNPFAKPSQGSSNSTVNRVSWARMDAKDHQVRLDTRKTTAAPSTLNTFTGKRPRDARG